MQNGVAVDHDDLEKPGQHSPQWRNGRKNADDGNQYCVGEPSIPVGLHGQQHVKENHHQQQKEHLLQSGNDNPVCRPLAHVHEIDDGLRGIHRVNQQMDQGVHKGNTEGQEPIADEAAQIVILFAGSQMHELCEIVKHKKEWGQDG